MFVRIFDVTKYPLVWGNHDGFHFGKSSFSSHNLLLTS